MKTSKPTYEELLQENENLVKLADFHKTILDHTVDWEMLLSPTGEFSYCSPSCKRISGYESNEFTENPNLFFEIIHPSDKDLVNQHFYKKKKNNIETDNVLEFRMITKDGNEKWIEHFCRKAYDKSGAFIGYRSSNRDISKRKATEIELQQANKLLRDERQIFTQGNAVIFKWKNSENWPVEYVSPNVEQIFGFTPEEMQSPQYRYSGFIFPEDLERVASEVTKFSSRNENYFEHEPYRVIGKNGEKHWVSDYTVILRNDTGQITHYIGYLIDISKLKLIEESLRESEENLFITLNSIGDGVIATDERGMVTRMNPVAEKLCGWPIADVRGKPLTEVFKIINALTREFVTNPVEIVMEKGFTVGLANHTILISKDGKEYQIADSAAPIKDKEGKIRGIILVFTDVTEEYNTQKILEENEKRYRAVFQNSPMGIMLLNETGIIHDANEANAIITGYSIDELIGSDVRRLVEPENVYSVDLNIKRILSGELLEHEVISCRKDGSRCVLFLRETAITLPDGKPGILSISSDITGQKRANDLLRESEEKYRFIAENTTEVIALLDLNLKYTYISPAVLSQRGYTVEEAMVKKLEEATTPETMKRVYQLLAEEMANEASGTADPNRSRSLELEQYCKDGSTIWVDASLSFTRDVNGTATGIFAVSRDITERIKSREAFRESERRYRTLFEAANYAIFLMKEGIFLDCNQKTLLFFGCSKNEIIGHSPVNFSPAVQPDGRSSAEKAAEKIDAALKGEPQVFEWAHQRLDGTVFSAEVSLNRIHLTAGTHILALVQDITERKQAEEALQKSEKKYRELSTLLRLMSDNMPDMLWAKNLNKEYIFVNEASCAGFLIAKDTEEPLGKTDMFFAMRERNSQPDNPEWHTFGEICGDSDAVTLEAMKPMQFDEFGNIKGKFLFLDVHKAPLYDNTGQLIGVVGSARDVTAAKEAENQLRKLSQAVEQSPASVVITDIKGTIEYVNSKFTEVTGYTSEEAIGQNPRILKSGEQAPEVYTELWETISAGKEWKGELHNKKKNGELYWESVLISPIKNEKGELLNYLAVKEDITEWKQAKVELIKAKEKAEESNRLKSAFLANMSHEIRTPMNGILGFAELLKEPHLTDEQQQEYIKIIRKSGTRMLNIINDIVDISKIESGIVEVHFSEVDINKQMELVYKVLKLEAESKGINISFTTGLPDTESIISTDSEKFYSVLANLVKNAIKYTEKGSIVFGYEKKEGYLEFYVKDTGIGIRQDRQEAVFERFIQADIENIMARQGSGLGLAISRAYVDMLGGNIWVESVEGKGSTFYFTLPYHTKTEKKTSIKNAAPAKASEYHFEKLKMLIVEDDDTSEKLITIAVKMLSKEILNVQTGLEAVETCRNHPDIDLVLMDIQIPDLNGYEATRQIRQFNKDVVIIAQTAYGMMGDREKALKAGCNDYIAKPIKKDELIEIIQKQFMCK